MHEGKHDPRPETLAKHVTTGGECAGRESAGGILRRRAADMRRESIELLKKAESFEQLANSAQHLHGDAEAALWRLVAERG